MNPCEPFFAERCVACGECLRQCPVLRLSPKAAREEAARRRDGRPSRRILSRCQSCLACNFVCPHGANPGRAMLDAWHEIGLREGFPARAAYFTPDQPNNFRTHVVNNLPADERALVASWDNETPCDEIFYPGCNVITSPYLTRTRLLADQNIRGSLALCCGEMYFRTGQYEMLERTAKRLTAWSRRLGFKKMIIPCTAGRNMFVNVLPRFGAHFDFEVTPLLSWLLARVESGEIPLRRPLDLTVTIQESCHAKFFGDEYLDQARRLLARLGARVIEQEHCRQKALCCGIAAGFSPDSAYHPWAITKGSVRVLREAKRTGAQALAVYCAGCLQMLSVGQIAFPNGLPIYHLLELVQLASDEPPLRRQRQRAFSMLQGVVLRQFPQLLSRRRFRPTDLADESRD
ncbi:MAG: (Fe-S)-binding protein [Myxococcales bacterium]|nr:(Fe-S)-binding protein [Myxococcales bacterium]